MRAAVLPEHRPTLGDLLRPRVGRRGMRVLVALAVLVAAAFAFRAVSPEDDGVDVVHRAGPVQFNFRYPEGLAPAKPQGAELLRLEARRRGLFIQSFAVEPLQLRPYRGNVDGTLPVFAAGEIEALRGRFAEFELVQDGKTRVNEVPGYTILFRARLGKRRLYGREVILPQPEPGARDGVRLLLLATPAGGVSNAGEVGVRGVVKRPFRTFRFGTEKP